MGPHLDAMMAINKVEPVDTTRSTATSSAQHSGKNPTPPMPLRKRSDVNQTLKGSACPLWVLRFPNLTRLSRPHDTGVRWSAQRSVAAVGLAMGWAKWSTHQSKGLVDLKVRSTCALRSGGK